MKKNCPQRYFNVPPWPTCNLNRSQSRTRQGRIHKFQNSFSDIHSEHYIYQLANLSGVVGPRSCLTARKSWVRGRRQSRWIGHSKLSIMVEIIACQCLSLRVSPTINLRLYRRTPSAAGIEQLSGNRVNKCATNRAKPGEPTRNVCALSAFSYIMSGL